MRILPITVVLLLLAPPARAEVGEFWQEHDTALLTTGASVANFAGLFPGVGIGMSLNAEVPSKTWAIAGIVAGSAQITAGTLSVINATTYDEQPWLAAYGVATSVLGLGNLVLGLLNLYRHERVIHRLEIMNLVVAPMPVEDGAGATLTFGL